MARHIAYRGKNKWPEIAADLEARIAGGGFAAGEIITITRLAAEYGVAREPAQRALHELAWEGMLKPLLHKGFEVIPDPGGADGRAGDGGPEALSVPGREKPAVTPLGQHLRALRRQKGWSPEALGRKALLSPQTISGIERSRDRAGKASSMTLARLSRALGLPEDYLTEFAENTGGPGQGTAAGPGAITVRLAAISECLARIETRLDRMEAHFPGPAGNGT